MAALRDGSKPGLNERELGDLVERAYVSQGAINVIHYIGVTAMDAPDLGVPRQFPRRRRVQSGDVVVAEISAAFWDHPGQVLRSFSLGEPNKLYRDLHAAADAAFDSIAAVLKAGSDAIASDRGVRVIEDAGLPSSMICCTVMAVAIFHRSSAAGAARPDRYRRIRFAPDRPS
jgi:Xaa-Pro aminopeptidase